MKIIYSPSYSGAYYMDMSSNNVAMGTQVLDTQGLIEQIALHVGLYHCVPTFPIRLAAYHKALCKYNTENPTNVFNESMKLDSMGVAKTLLQWRDVLAIAGWKGNEPMNTSLRLSSLAGIDRCYEDDSIAVLLKMLIERLLKMKNNEMAIPSVLKSLEISVPCKKEWLPDYIIPLLDILESLMGHEICYDGCKDIECKVQVEEIRFTQQWQSEAWLSQLEDNDYDLWINTNGKRLDNWLHMSGKPVSGSIMKNGNPQITQLFILAVQLFQRPLDVNILLQYLLLPECPIDWDVRFELARNIVSDGGFTDDKIKEVLGINDFVELTRETSDIDKEKLADFLKNISKHATTRATSIAAMQPLDVRVAQLRNVAEMTNALLMMITDCEDSNISYKELMQWAQAIYESADYIQYQAQVGCRFTIDKPENIIGNVRKVIWCDFYGDVTSTLSTDFLSPKELDSLKNAGVKLWNVESEKCYQAWMRKNVLRLTTEKLTVVTCNNLGASTIPMHPLYIHLPKDRTKINGDELYKKMLNKSVSLVDNHRLEDETEVTFDADKYKVSWRDTESHTSLTSLLQNPLDYVMKYILGFHEVSASEIKMSLTNGNVAHETIEKLFTDGKDSHDMKRYVETSFDGAFANALARKGALLLLPEHHIDKDRLQFQLRRCIMQLVDVITSNRLKLIGCERKGSITFSEIQLDGYIDMLFQDADGHNVVIDLKWTTKKDKFKKLIQENRAAQLAIYKAMCTTLDKTPDHIKTGFFVMPLGKLFTSDSFVDDNVEIVKPEECADVMTMIVNGYEARKEEINRGKIETAGGMLLSDIDYSKKENVFPLDSEGKKEKKKVENKYSDYNCFMN